MAIATGGVRKAATVTTTTCEAAAVSPAERSVRAREMRELLYKYNTLQYNTIFVYYELTKPSSTRIIKMQIKYKIINTRLYTTCAE